jgi:serine/threonine protein kinase
MREVGIAALEKALVGTTLAERYRIDRVVGSGGFGVVFGGHHLTLDVAVAIKVLHLDEVSDNWRERAFERFQQEAKTLAQLRHPHIARVLDTGVRDADERLPQLPWLVMDWYDGPTLTRELASRSTPHGPGGRSRAACWRLFHPIVDAVAHAHSQGVVHRDLKPDNIIIVDGAPVVLDFGIAKVMEEDEKTASDSAATQSDHRAFTPAYAAPEQFAGVRTGPWTDVHALGLILTELLTGTRAYRNTGGAELLREAIADERPTPAIHGVDAGPWEAVIAKALAAAAPERFQDAGQLLRALNQSAPPLDTVAIGEDDTVLHVTESAPPPGDKTAEPLAVPRVAKLSLPPPARSRWLAGSAVMALLLGAAWWLGAREQEQPAPPATSASSSAAAPTVPLSATTGHPFGAYNMELIEARLLSAGWEIYDRDATASPGARKQRLDIRRKGLKERKDLKGSVSVHEWESSVQFTDVLEQLSASSYGATESRVPSILHVVVKHHPEEGKRLLSLLAKSEPPKLQLTPQAIADSRWERLPVPTRARLNASWGSSNQLYVIGNHGTVLRFDGVSWHTEDTPANDDLIAVWGRGDGEIYAVGILGGILRRSGGVWQRERANESRGLRAVGGNSSRVVAVGGRFVWERGDDGWEPTKTDATDLCAVASEGDAIDVVSLEGGVFRSTAAGSWAKHARWPRSDDANWPLISDNISTRYHSDANWVQHAEDLGWLPLSFARHEGSVFLVGQHGGILVVDESFIPKQEPSGTTANLNHVWVVDDGTMFVVGGQGTVLRRPN